ncbi:MAG: nucleotidyltransferase domain-containing protein [Candidatus Bathyarchaeia archaeon]
MGSSEVRFFKLNYEAVINELREYAKKALEKGALSVILIGSLARGDYTAFSDADVIIIVEESSERPMDRIARFIETKTLIDVDVRVYTLEEIENMMKCGSRIICEVAEHGIILGGKQEIIKRIKRAIRQKSP